MLSPVTDDRTTHALRGEDLDLAHGGRRVVEGATLAVVPGRVTALVGPNGSGKSTLLRALARLHPPVGGDVVFDDGATARTLSARDFARRVTLLAQQRATPAGVSVVDVVGYGRYPHRSRLRGTDPGAGEAIARALALTGLEALDERAVDSLSGGELQRVWLASCLAQDTRVLLLDEPTTYLDLRYQVEVLDLVRDLADDHGVAVGVVLHDLDQAAAVADTVALLHAGRIRDVGAPSAVLTAEALTDTYGIRVDVTVDHGTGRVTTRPVGRHADRHVAV